MPNKIIDSLSIGLRPPRSISLERDLYVKTALDHYLVTPMAAAALAQIGQALQEGSEQRAWKLVGPYGSGKSALGLVAAQLLAGKALFPATAKRVKAAASETYAYFQNSHRCPVAVVGSRVSFGVALARSIQEVVSGWKQNKAATAFGKKLDETAATYAGLPLNSAIALLVQDFSAAAIDAGFDGVAIFVDELGKFVEHAALVPEEGDLIGLQQLAELACGAGDQRPLVIAMLHQHLSDYAASVGRGLSDEWEKVASRFEEIPFDEPVERYAHFARHSIGVGAPILGERKIKARGKDLFGRALEQGVLRSHSSSDAELFGAPEALYPLHPMSIAALAVISKRFGQSERTFHAFLRGDEPFGLRSFASAQGIDADGWYRLSHVYDYLAAGHGLRFRDRNAERRWLFAVACIDRESSNAVASAVLKTVAMLELIQVGLRIPSTAAVVQLALDDLDAAAIEVAFDDLVKRGVLLKRRNVSEYAFAVAEAVNIEALYETAISEDESLLVLGAVKSALTQRLIVASKHYDTFGTLRTLGICVGTSQVWPAPPKRVDGEAYPDGWLNLLLVTPGTAEEKQCEKRFADIDDPLVIHACLKLDVVARAALVEYAAWLHVQVQLSTKHVDPWASQHVSAKMQEARDAVERSVVAQLTPAPKRKLPRFWHCGKPVQELEQSSLSKLASWLFDTVFSQAPRLVNELINKDRPPSAIVLARQKMFDVVLGGDFSKPICGQNEFPPERLIHHTLLRDTGIWQEKDGIWSLHEPSPTAQLPITAVWDRISETLRSPEETTYGDVVEALSRPPLGVRAGPAGVWIAMYLIVNRSRCSVFERGTLALEMTSERLQRMYKGPANFVLKEIVLDDDATRLLGVYRSVLAHVGTAVEDELTYLEIARALYRWTYRLPGYANDTRQVSKGANLVRATFKRGGDPIKFLLESLPAAHLESRSSEDFEAWLTQSLVELGMAQRKLQEQVSNILGRCFRISGGLSRIRTQLQSDCAGVTSDLGEAQLKSFILRCADLTLTDERWLDSVASLVVHRSLDGWNDDTVGRFEAAMTELSSQYRRWLKLIMHRGQNPKIGARFLSLTLTHADGGEASLFVAPTERSKAAAATVIRDLTTELGEDRELMAAALAQALMELQSQIKPAEDGAAAAGKEDANEQREAS